MKEKILDLIENDINISRFLYCQKKHLQIDAERLNTDNASVIFAIMLIQDTDRVFDTYFDLISSGLYLEESELKGLKETVFCYLVSLQHDPESRINDIKCVELGVLKIHYSW